MSIHKFQLFADYHQVYIMDEKSDDDTGEIWNEFSSDIHLAIAKNTVAVGTYRNVTIPFEIEVVNEEPLINLDAWDHISQGYFSVISGKCSIFGCTEYVPDADIISIPIGDYSIYSLAKGLNTIKTEWEDAEDYYKVIMWLSSKKQHQLIKKYDIKT